MEIRIQQLDNIGEAARQFVQAIGQHRVFAFYGKMGAGKTTFIKAICEELGVQDVITSPTFAIVNEYTIEPHNPPLGQRTLAGQEPSSLRSAALDQRSLATEGTQEGHLQGKNAQRVYHFDFYRIKKLEEVYDMGYEDYFYSGDLCFIEWPELIEELLPDDAVSVTIEEQADGTRSVVF